MVKLPDEFSISRTAAPSNTPNVSIRAPDFSPIAQAGRALGQGIQSVAGGIQAYADASGKIQDDDAVKRLIDFKTDTELGLEDYKRNMPETGIGFRDGWDKEYDKRARKFFKTVPKHLRKQIDMDLVQHNARLTERAQGYEWGQNDRHESDSLEKSLNKITGIAASDPARLKEMEQTGIARINASRVPTAVKLRAKQKFRSEVSRQTVKTRIDGAIRADDYKGIKKDLAPRTKDPIARASVKSAGGGYSHVIAASGAKFRVANAHSERFAGLVEELEAAGVKIDRSQSGGYADRNIAGTTKKSKHASGSAIDINWTANARGQPGNIRKVVGVDKIREIARRHGLKWGGDWKNPDDMHFEVDRRLTPQPRAALESEPSGTRKSSYSGPYASLSLDQRRALWNQAQSQRKRQINALGNEISKMDGLAVAGQLPEKKLILDLEGRILQTGDKELYAKFNSVINLSDNIYKMFKSSPRAAAQFARTMRDGVKSSMGEGRMTPEQAEALKRFDQAADTVRREVKADAMTWAHNQGVRVGSGAVKLEPLNFGDPSIDETLKERFRQAGEVGDYYSQPAQAFTKQDRETLGNYIARGGDGAKFVLGKIVQTAGNDAMRFISEFTKDAPEAYMIGSLMFDGGDPKLIDEATKEMKRRTEMGDKYINMVDRALVAPDVASIMPVLKNTPALVDPVRRMTDTIYNYRHRAQGLDAFDADLYKSTMQEVLGQTKDRDGTLYGGMGKQGDGWFDGKSSNIVLVPNGVKQDSFDDFVGSIRKSDYSLVGTPRYGDGSDLSIEDVQRARWLSLGHGRYGLQIKESDDGSPVLAVDDNKKPFVLDTRKLMGRMHWRRPELFQGYDSRLDMKNSLTQDYGSDVGVSP